MRYLVTVLLAVGCGSVDSKTKPDAAGTDTQCVPESDTAFCGRIANACESHSAADNCGAQRTVDCGACGSGMGCVVGTCKVPVCSSLTFSAPAPLTAFARTGVEDSIGGATPDGRTILYIKTEGTSGCGNYHLVVADEIAPGSGTYTQRDVYSSFVALGLWNGQDGHGITADGLTIISKSADGKKLMSTTRSAINAIDFAAASETDFAQINGQLVGTSGTFFVPTISADGLELFFTILGADATTDGIYSSVRTSTTVPFPAGTKLPPPVSDYHFATGVSSDRLTLFVLGNSTYANRILSRKSTSQPFINPNAPAAPPVLGGWQHKPLADCSKLIAMTSPGGCANEDVVLLTRQ